MSSITLLPSGTRVMEKTMNLMNEVKDTLEINGPKSIKGLTDIIKVCRRKVSRAIERLLEEEIIGEIPDIFDMRKNKYYLMR